VNVKSRRYRAYPISCFLSWQSGKIHFRGNCSVQLDNTLVMSCRARNERSYEARQSRWPVLDFRAAARSSRDRAFSDYPRPFGRNRKSLANRVTSIRMPLFIYRNKRTRDRDLWARSRKNPSTGAAYPKFVSYFAKQLKSTTAL